MQGIAQSPNVGFGDCRNLDIYTTPGIAKINNPLVKKSGTTVDALVKWIVRDPDTVGNVFALDSNGVLYKSADSGATWTEVSDRAGTGQGLAVAWGYVFVCVGTTIDVMKISDNTWTTGWQTIKSDSLWQPMLLSELDGRIYGGAGNHVFYIEQLTTFTPADTATYDFNASALATIPSNKRIKCLAELGNNLMIGTWQGTNIYDFKKATIYPWTTTTPTYSQPIQITENGVNSMINIGNNLIVSAGIDGKLFRSDGYNVVQIAQIPQSIANLSGGKYLEVMPGAMINYKGRLFFGISGSGIIDGCGIYSLMQTSSGNILVMEHSISTGNTGRLKQLQIGALLGISRDELLCAWRDDTSYGIDKTNNASFASENAYFETPMYEVSSNKNKAKIQEFELFLDAPMRVNEVVYVDYRLNGTEEYTAIDTYDYATFGDIEFKNIILKAPREIKATEQIQFRVWLEGTTTTPSFRKIAI